MLGIEPFEKILARRNIAPRNRGTRLLDIWLGPSEVIVAHRLEIGDRHHQRFVDRTEAAPRPVLQAIQADRRAT